MSEIGGRLIEIERKEIEPTMVYYKAVREPMRVIANLIDVTMEGPQSKREVWLAKARPVTKDDFAVFLLDRID